MAIFNPEDHLTRLPVRKFSPENKRYETSTADYLEVKWRMVWYRTMNKEKTQTEVRDKIIDRDSRFAYFELAVTDEKGNTEVGVGSETGEDFRDYIEKAYTKAYGRALASLGYGTQFAPDLEEGERIVDAPVQDVAKENAAAPARKSRKTAAAAPAIPTQIPQEGSGTSYGGPRSVDAETANPESKMSDSQRRAIFGLYRSLHLSDDEVRAMVRTRYNLPDGKHLDRKQASDLISHLKALESTAKAGGDTARAL